MGPQARGCRARSSSPRTARAIGHSQKQWRRGETPAWGQHGQSQEERELAHATPSTARRHKMSFCRFSHFSFQAASRVAAKAATQDTWSWVLASGSNARATYTLCWEWRASRRG